MLNEKRELQNHKTNNSIPRAPFFPPATIQPKLSINTPGDAYEQEADAMADKVMRMQIPASQDSFFKPALSSIQRKCKGCEDEDKKLHRKESNGGETHGSNELESYVSSLRSSGQPLPDISRQFFEPRFGQDFSNVRIHTDSIAAKSAQSINALAYTTGNNIVFNEGQYAPGSDSGNRLMAHELTHVMQQGSTSTGKSIQRQNIPDPTASFIIRYNTDKGSIEVVADTPKLPVLGSLGIGFRCSHDNCVPIGGQSPFLDGSNEMYSIEDAKKKLKDSGRKSSAIDKNSQCPDGRVFNPFWKTCCPEAKIPDEIGNCINYFDYSKICLPGQMNPDGTCQSQSPIHPGIEIPPSAIDIGDFELPDSNTMPA